MKIFIALVFCLHLTWAKASHAETIREIEVAENSKTTDDTVLFIADIEEGDDWDAGEQDRVRNSLVSSGLFKDVEIFSEPHKKGGVKVTILAKDKHSWVIAPTYYNQPTNKGFGVGFGENNLFGENKKLLLYGQLATGDSFFIGAFIDPSLFGTIFNLQLDVLLRNERVIEYAIPTEFTEAPDPVRQSRLRYLNSGLKLGINLFRRLDLSARIRGAWVGYGDSELQGNATLDDVGPSLTAVPNPGKEGWDVSTEFVAKWDRRANWYGITSGNKYAISYEMAQPVLGSDFEYHYTTLSFETAHRLLKTANFIVKGSVAWGRDLPFQQEFTSGGTNLRGYKGRQFRGDFKTGGTAEYSFQLFNIKGLAVRGLGFWDSTYTSFFDVDQSDYATRNYLPNTGDHGIEPFRNSVGFGTRFYLRQIVLPLLGLDYGYAVETGETEIYFAIGLTDL